MFSNLFGKSKKSTGSTSSIPPMSPSASDVSMPSPGGGGHTDEDGFEHLATVTGQMSLSDKAGARASYPGYPALPRTEESPAVAAPYPTGTLSSQYSMTGSHALDGVPFTLSGRCSTSKDGGVGSEFDVALDDIMQRMENAKSILQSATYDFQVEKSVVEQT